jgi:uncharacterized repeat protein (TIGR01451 family)
MFLLGGTVVVRALFGGLRAPWRRPVGFVLAMAVVGLTLLGAPSAAVADGTTATPSITITETADGQPAFDATAGPGNDTGPNNGVVRTNQLITYNMAMSINDPTAPSQTTFQDTTATFAPLPLGFVWNSIPLECSGPNTKLTGNGVTTPSVLVCDFGAKTTGTTWTMTPSILALRTAVSGTTVAPTATLSATGMVKTATSTASGVAISVSAAPKAGLTKGNTVGPNADILNGQAASSFFWPFGIHIDDGSDIINGNSFSFTDDLSSLPAGATFKKCSQNLYTNLPDSYQSTTSSGALDGVPNNGGATWTCTVDASNPKLVHITVTGVNTNPAPANCPTLGGDGVTSIPSDICYVSTWGINVTIPNASLGTNGASGTNWVSQLSATDLAGNPNYGGNPDPGTGMDNNQVASNSALVGRQHGWTSILRSLASQGGNPFPLYKSDFRTTGSGGTTGGTVGSSQWSGDGYVTQGGTYASREALFFGGIADLPAGFIMCTTIDNVHDVIGSLNLGGTVQNAAVTGSPSYLNQPGMWTLQYGTGGNGGVNSGDGTGWSSYTAQQQGSCNTSDSPSWYSSVSQVPGGAGAVTKVRFVLNQTITIAQQVAALNANQSEVDGWVALQVRSTATNGTIVPNYGWATNDPAAVTASNPTGTVTSTYNYATAANGGLGDRITVTGVRVRASKSAAQAQYLAGQNASFTLSPSTDPIGASPAPQALNVALTDTLPAGLSYVGGSAIGSANYSASCSTTACAPTSVTVNPDGTTTLVWQLGSSTAGSALPQITYKALISPGSAGGTNYVNTVVASADNDTSPAQYRTGTATINITGGASFSVAKSSPQPLTEPGTPKQFSITFANLSSQTYPGTDFIDWLPFNGDQRAPASSFQGTSTLAGPAVDAAGAQTVTFKYTSYATSNLVFPQDTDPATMNSAILWCTQAQFGTPGCPASFAAVTGIQMLGGQIGPQATDTVNYSINVAGDVAGNVFSNQLTGEVTGIGLPISSNTATVKTVLGSIAGTVWDDTSNKNGIIDTGEPDLPMVTVQLLDSTGKIVATTTTNSSGAYTFPNLFHGTYSVHVVQPSGYTTTQPFQGTNPAVNSHINYGTNTTNPITLAIGQNDTTENAGFVADKPAIAIEKDLNGTHANDPSNPLLVPTGSTLNVTFKVTNTGNLALSPVTVTDDTVSNVSCPATSLAAGASMTCTGTTLAPSTPGGTHKNTATATGSPLGLDGTPLVDASGNKAANVTATDSGFAFTPDPHLALVKSATPVTVQKAGDTVSYSFAVTNTGNVTLTGVSVAETAFSGTGTAPAIACPAGAASLAPGASVTCTATYQVTQADVDAGTITNTAVAQGTPPLSMPAIQSNPSSATVTAQPGPAISLVKSASPTTVSKAGDTVTYSFLATNTGNVTLSNIGITETAFSGTGTMSAVSCPVTSLAPGASTTCAATYQVTQADVDAGTITNTATAAGTPPNSTTPVVSAPSSATVTAQQNAAISLVKSATPTTVRKAGDTVTYSFAVTNTGNVTLTNIGATETAFSGSGSMSAITCPVTTLSPGVSTTCTATYQVTQADVDAGTITNTAAAHGTPPGTAAPVVSAPSSALVMIPAAPAIALVKSATPTTVRKAGDTVTYSFAVTNTGNVTLTGISVAETAFSGTGTMSAITCPAGAASLAPGASTTCTATYQVTQADVDAGTITNTATAAGTPPGATAPVVSAPSSATVTANQSASIGLVKSATPSDAAHFTVGQQVTYSFVVTNTGNVTLSNVSVADTSFTGHGALSAVTCPVTVLAPGAQTVCTATYTIDQADVDAGSVTNTAVSQGTPPGSTTPVVSAPSTVTIPGQQNPALSLVKTATPAQVSKAGDTVTYSFLVTNTGNVTLGNIGITETAFTGTGAVPAASCPATTLAPGQFTSCTATYQVTQADVDAGTITNTATAHGTPPNNGTPVVSNPSTATVTAQQSASIALVKTATPTQVSKAGDTVTYSFAVTNTGNTTLANVGITETTFTGTGTPPAIACPVGAASLAPGASVTCTATYQVTQADVDAGTVRNTATATGTPPGTTGPVTSTPSSAVVTIPAAPAITLVKTATPTTVNKAGDTVTYSFLVTNTGNVTLANAGVTETAFSGTGTAPVISCPAGAGSLASGASVTCTATYRVTQADVDAGTVTNTATAAGTPPGTTTPVVSAPSSAKVTIPAAGSLALVKTADRPSVSTAGDMVTYSFKVTNTGNVTLTGVTVHEDSFNGAAAMGPATCPAAAASLAPGATVTCTATYQVSKTDLGTGSPLVNTATAHGKNPTGGDVASKPSTATVTTPSAPVADPPGAKVETGGYLLTSPAGRPWWAWVLTADLALAGAALAAGTVLALARRRNGR